MLGIMDILVFYERISKYVQTHWEIAKEATRNYLGPSPNTTYLLFDNEDVIPAGKEHCKYPYVAHYSPTSNRITSATEAPYKRLPWISIRHIIGDHEIDLTEWLSEVRTNTPVSLMAILRIASHTLNVHLPETDHAKVLVIMRDGEGDEEEFKYSGKTKLLKRIASTPIHIGNVEMHRKDTCPYDTSGPLFF